LACSSNRRSSTAPPEVAHILQKLGLRDRVQAVVFAYEAGLVRPGARAANHLRGRRRHEAREALRIALDRLHLSGRGGTVTLAELFEEYLAQHNADAWTIAKLRWLLRKAMRARGGAVVVVGVVVVDLRPGETGVWRRTVPEGIGVRGDAGAATGAESGRLCGFRDRRRRRLAVRVAERFQLGDGVIECGWSGRGSHLALEDLRAGSERRSLEGARSLAQSRCELLLGSREAAVRSFGVFGRSHAGEFFAGLLLRVCPLDKLKRTATSRERLQQTATC